MNVQVPDVYKLDHLKPQSAIIRDHLLICVSPPEPIGVPVQPCGFSFTKGHNPNLLIPLFEAMNVLQSRI